MRYLFFAIGEVVIRRCILDFQGIDPGENIVISLNFYFAEVVPIDIDKRRYFFVIFLFILEIRKIE